MGGRQTDRFKRVKMVRVSQELYDEMKLYAEPLSDSFEAACWKVLAARVEFITTIEGEATDAEQEKLQSNS